MNPTKSCVLTLSALLSCGQFATQSHAQAAFYGVGDLPGGIVYSEVRDVTKIGGVIRAVGGSAAAAGSTGSDTAIYWTSTGGMVAIPNLVANPTATTFITASAITPDGAFIAARSRNVAVGGTRNSVRVTTSGFAKVDFGGLAGFSGNSAAIAISADGSILYGLANNNSQAVRYTVSGPTGTLIPFLNAGDVTSSIVGRGCSTNGNVAVGSTVNPSGGRAFRYVHGAGLSAIPLLPGGTNNYACAISPDGNLTLVAGGSSSAPKGEFYLHDAVGASVRSLGTPRGSLEVGNGGMSSDGSVVVVCFNNSTATSSNVPFLRNAQGWHELQSVASGAGANLAGWTLNVLVGVSPDGTLVWGRGLHNGNEEGWILEFPAGYLAAVSRPRLATAVGPDIVGAWIAGDTLGPDATVIFFLSTGEFIHATDVSLVPPADAVDGFERGIYRWNPTNGVFTCWSLRDYNGTVGLADLSGLTGITATVSGNALTVNVPGEGSNQLTRVTGTNGIVGGWLKAGSDVAGGSFEAYAFMTNNSYYMVGEGVAQGGSQTGIERGTYTWNPTTGFLTSVTVMDNNGTLGLNSSSLLVPLNGDVLLGSYNRVKGTAFLDAAGASKQAGGAFAVPVLGRTGKTNVLEASTNLVNWTPISTNVVTTGVTNLVDPQAAAISNRFYRVIVRP